MPLPAGPDSTAATPRHLVPTQGALERMREVQAWGKSFKPSRPSPGATAPDLCLAAAKFMVGKLIRLYSTSQHLNDFLRSEPAGQLTRTLGAGSLNAAFGSLKLKNPEIFNKDVLPASIKWGGLKTNPSNIQFVYMHDASKGDSLLRQRVPLVVGVSLSPTGTRDHFIVVVQSTDNDIWAIDSWGNWRTGSVVKLPAGMSFLKSVKVDINAGVSTIPCATPYFGYYEENRTPLRVSVAL